jgi:hypothetical protein
MPALPLDEAGKYVAAAYLVFVTLLLVYIVVMAARLVRIQRELEEIARLADEEDGAREPAAGDPRVAPDPGSVSEKGADLDVVADRRKGPAASRAVSSPSHGRR